MALENPLVRFIGIDINEVSHATSVARQRQNRCENVLFIHAEAAKYVSANVADESVSAFHIYFPTPYIGEIRDHNILGGSLKGRLVQKQFLLMLQRKARAGAVFRLITDVEPYFTFVASKAEDLGLAFQPWTSPLRREPLDGLVGSGCEREQLALNKKLWRLQCLLK